MQLGTSLFSNFVQLPWLSLLPAVVGIPLMAAIATLVLASVGKREKLSAAISHLAALLQLLLVIGLLFTVSGYSEGYRYALGRWGAPLGIDLFIDGLSVTLLLFSALIVLVLGIYSSRYFSGGKRAHFWPLWWLLNTGLNTLFIAGDAFNIYVALELIGLSSVALVALSNTPKALSAALRYALVGLLGSLLYLFGVALLYRTYGTLDLAQLAALSEASSMTWAVMALITVGLILKTALLPLHFWLPHAHANAPVPVSAVLSALVVKASFYLLIRFWFEVLTPSVTHVAANFLGALGALAIIWGCVCAYKARRLKLLVAYSTVAQIGYLFLLFPLAFHQGINHAALVAVVYFVVAHALAKSAMFLACGNIHTAYGHDDITRLKGVALGQPLALTTFAIAGVSLIGLPPSSGFIAKWLMLNTAIDNGQWWWIAVIVVGGLLSVLYIGRVLNLAFEQKPSSGGSRFASDVVSTRSVPVRMTVCGLCLAVSAVALGFNAQWLMQLLNHAAQPLSAEVGAMCASCSIGTHVPEPGDVQ